MGLSVKKAKGKFVLTHSVDGHSTKPLSKTEAILWVHRSRACDIQIRFIEDWFCFPHGWGDNNGRIIWENAEGQRQWREWWDKALRNSTCDEEYHAAVEAKYNEVMALTRKEAGKDA